MKMLSFSRVPGLRAGVALGLVLGFLSGAGALGAATGAAAAPTPPLPWTTPAEAGISAERLETMHAWLRDRIATQPMAGCISVLARDGQLVDWWAHGVMDARTGEPLRKDAIIRLYSMSKIITSVGALILLEEGRLRLGDPVEKFLPALANREVYVSGEGDDLVLAPAERAITIKDLLTHTAGYYYGASWSAPEVLVPLAAEVNLWEAEDLDGFIAKVAQLPLAEQPGTRFRYGISTDIVGAVIEKASGQTLDVFLRERIFAPLGMVDTGFVLPPARHDRLARVHRRTDAGALEVDTEDFGLTDAPMVFSGGGGLFSTAHDYTRFAQMLLNQGELDGTRILGRKTVELMTRNHLEHLDYPHPSGQRSQGFGLGVRVYNASGHGSTPESPGTFGWDAAASTCVQIDPVERTVALILPQHFPFNDGNLHTYWSNLYHAAIVD